MKFKDFSMAFQDFFKQTQNLLYKLKPERFTHCFQNKLYYSVLLNWLILIMKNNQWQVTLDENQPCKVAVFGLQHCGIKNVLTNSIFLSFLELKK